MGENCNCNAHTHGSGCHEEGTCCCCGKTHGCHCGCHKEHCHCLEKFLAIADEAWTEVLKEKIKTKILEHKGEKIEELAKIIAKANGERWKNKITAKTKRHEFKDSLKEYFSSSCECD